MTQQALRPAAIGVSWGGMRRAAFMLDIVIGRVAEVLGALLVLAETCILFTGVVSRYVFNSPILWTDELATFLFLWLAMFGAVVALRRDGHMRLTTFVNWCSPVWGNWLSTVAELVVIVFVLEIIFPARVYLGVQASTELITLHISDGYRVLAILVGAGLIATVALLRMLESSSLSGFLAAVAVVGAVAGGLWLAQPALMAMGAGSLILFFVVIVAVCVFIGVPIAFTFGIATLSYLALMTRMPLVIVVNRLDDGISNLLLLAVPMFVFLGLLMEMTGIARVMVNFLAAMVGHVKGGLSYVLLGAMYLVSGISGSKAADMAAVAPVLFPEMQRRGMHPGELSSLLATSGAMSETIPPSLVLITIGSVAGGVDRGAVHRWVAAGLCRRRWPSSSSLVRSRGERSLGRAPRDAGAIAAQLSSSRAGAGLPFVIRFTVIKGVATATEVSTVGVVYTVLVGLLVYRRFDWRRLYPMLVETASLSGAILMIIGTATAMAWALTQSGFSRQLVADDGGGAGRKAGFPRGLDRRLHRSRQRARGHAGDRAVRAAAVPGGAGDRRARGALCDGRDPGDGHRPLRAALRSRVLRRLRDRPHHPQRCAVAGLALYRRARRRTADRRGGPVAVDRVPVIPGGGKVDCSSDTSMFPPPGKNRDERRRPPVGLRRKEGECRMGGS